MGSRSVALPLPLTALEPGTPGASPVVGGPTWPPRGHCAGALACGGSLGEGATLGDAGAG